MNRSSTIIGRRWSRGFCILMAFFIAFGLMSVSPLSQTATADAAQSNVTLAAWNVSDPSAGSGVVQAFPATGGVNKAGSEITLTATAITVNNSPIGSFTKAVAPAAGIAGVTASTAADAFTGSSWAPFPQTVTTNQYWKVKISSTAGYENVALNFNAYGTGSSPASWEAKYSTDGVTFNSFSPAQTYTSDTRNEPANAAAASINLSTLDDEAGPVYVGLFATAASTNATGNNRICNVRVIGDEIDTSGGTPKVSTPTAGTANGTYLPMNSLVSLSSSTPGSTIYYTVSGDEIPADPIPGDPGTTVYTGPVDLLYGELDYVTIKAVATAPGYTDSDMAVFTYNSLHQKAIDQARLQAVGTPVIVEGTVTKLIQSSATNTTNCTMYIQDGTGGIAVYRSGITLSSFTEGQRVLVRGNLGTNGGVLQVQPASLVSPDIEVLPDTPTPLHPELITIAQLNSGNYEGKLVRIEDVRLSAIASNSNHTIIDKLTSAQTTMRCTENSGLPGFAADDYINAVGIASNNNGAKQLLVSLVADVTPGSEPPDPVLARTDGSGTIAEWRVNNNEPWIGSTSIPATGGDFQATSTLQMIKKTGSPAAEVPQTLNFSSAGANLSGLNVPAGDAWWLTTISTDGFTNIHVDFGMRSSGTGPRDFKLEYSTSAAGPWTDANDPNIIVPNAAWGNYSKTLPNDASGQPVLYLRWVLNSTTSAAGNTVGSAGTHQFNNVVITGDYLVGENQLMAPIVDPAPGEIPIGQVITLSPKTDDSAVVDYQVMVDEGDGIWTAAVNNEYTVAALPLTLKFKATASGKDDSRVITGEYAQATVQTPKASAPSGPYDALPSGVTISSTEGAEIWYTTDGSTPEKNGATSTLYTTAVEVPISAENPTFALKAIAYKDGYIDSSVASYTYDWESPDVDYNLYFGMIHSHSNLSDGAGEVEDAFAYAKNVGARGDNLDFWAVTDHSNMFDNDFISTTNKASINDPNGSTEFARGHAAADAVTDSNFVGIYGFEMTWSASTGGFGHINTFNTTGFESRNWSNWTSNTPAQATNGLYRYYQTLKTAEGSISQLNHPGTTFGDFLDFKYLDAEIDEKITMVEAGNGEGAIGSGGYFRSYDYYTRALDKGWHVAPTNNQDNHMGKWGDANTARTVILAKTLTRSSIYDALRNRRAYSTEDNFLGIMYTMNNKIMGYIYPEGTAPTGPSEVKVKLTHPEMARIAGATVSVIVNYGKALTSTTVTNDPANGKTLVTNPDGTAEFNWTVSVPSNYAYYYIQVEETALAQGKYPYRAATAPVFFGKAEMLGFNATVCNDIIPIGGKETSFTSTFYNDEAAAFTIDSLQYKMTDAVGNEVIIKEESGLNLSVPTGGTARYDFSYTPSKLGAQVITVTANATFGGEARTFTDTLNINIADPKAVSIIGLDVSKYGEYVSGNYAGSYKNFLKVCAANNVAVKKITAVTAEQLEGCNAVIIPTPSTRSGTYTPSDGSGATAYTAQAYTPEELAVLKNYADGGGNFIVAGLGDFYDNASASSPYHAATQINAVLSAIGAQTRLDDDALVDFETNGGQAYRLYFEQDGLHNPDSIYTEGVGSSVEQRFSIYRGASLTLGPDSEWIVKGRATTFGVDADGDSGTKVTLSTTTLTMPVGMDPSVTGNGVVKAYGDVPVLAADTLPGGGKAFIGGSTFFSDFEISDFDANNGLQYSNMMITWNMLKAIEKPLPQTAIATARQGQLGEVFRVEGIVTAGTRGFDEGHGFFDCMYVQDETGGVNVFGITDDMKIQTGQKVSVTGIVHEYKGDVEFMINSSANVKVIDETLNPMEPTEISTTEARDLVNFGGLLAKITGTVTKVTVGDDGKIAEVWVKDDADTSEWGSCLFIDGYITGYMADIEVGDNVSGVGLVSAGDIISAYIGDLRLRVRDRAEIINTADLAAAQAVEAQINALPDADDITLDDKDAVATVKDAYDALTDDQKALVSQEAADKLAEDVAKIARLEADKADREAADAVIAQINALPAADDITAADKAAVEAADKALNDLTDAQKALIGPDELNKLQAAKDKIAAIEKDQADQAAADKVKAQIDAIGNVTLDSEAKIKAAEDAYNALTADQKAKVPAATTAALTAAKAKLTQLKAAAVQSVVVNPVTGDVVSGTGGIPGGTIKITLPDGTTATATVSSSATWSVTVPGASIAATATVAVIGKDGVQVGSYSVTLAKKVTGVKTLAKVYLVKGKSVTLPGAVQPYFATDKKVTWKSSKPKIVSVSKTGKIKGLKKGKAVITVTTNDGKKTAKCTVYVITKATKANTLKKLTLTQKKANFGLERGKTYQVKYKLTPAKSSNKTGIVPTFTSSSKKIAVIDKAGVITALAPGKTKITVKAGKYRKSFMLYVGTVKATSIKIDKSSASIAKGKTVKLKATSIAPDTTNPKTVIWTSSNTKIARVSATGAVKGLKKGKVTITAMTWNGKAAKCKVTVK